MSIKDRIKVLSWPEIPPIEIGNKSWSRLVITGETAGAEKSMLGISTFTPGTDTPQKIHEEEEFCYVISGHGQITIGDEAVKYGPGDFIYIPPGIPHGVSNPGVEDVVMIFGFSWPGYPTTTDA
ncbi:MAG: cupin domain-containing protein [Anaerolineales bacterium]|nr:cupin domain-containing protein [Anaerolineales bacterium]